MKDKAIEIVRGLAHGEVEVIQATDTEVLLRTPFLYFEVGKTKTGVVVRQYSLCRRYTMEEMDV